MAEGVTAHLALDSSFSGSFANSALGESFVDVMSSDAV
jgi:hypothetical protein